MEIRKTYSELTRPFIVIAEAKHTYQEDYVIGIQNRSQRRVDDAASLTFLNGGSYGGKHTSCHVKKHMLK